MENAKVITVGSSQYTIYSTYRESGDKFSDVVRRVVAEAISEFSTASHTSHRAPEQIVDD